MKKPIKPALCLLCLALCLLLAACGTSAQAPSSPESSAPAAEATPTPGPPSSQVESAPQPKELSDEPVTSRARVVGKDGEQLAVALEGECDFVLTRLPAGCKEEILPGMTVDILRDPWVNDIWPASISALAVTPVEDDGGLLALYLDALEDLTGSRHDCYASPDPDSIVMPTYGFDLSGVNNVEPEVMKAAAAWFAWKRGASAVFGSSSIQGAAEEDVFRVDVLYTVQSVDTAGEAPSLFVRRKIHAYADSFTTQALEQDGRWVYQHPLEMAGETYCIVEPVDPTVEVRYGPAPIHDLNPAMLLED